MQEKSKKEILLFILRMLFLIQEQLSVIRTVSTFVFLVAPSGQQYLTTRLALW